MAFQHFPAQDILPFWADDDHTVLDCGVRLYSQEVWNGYQKELVEKVEIFKADGLWRYLFQNDRLIPDVEAGAHENYVSVVDGAGGLEEFNWTRIPLIPFKYNKRELPLLNRVKPLQDAINLMLSDLDVYKRQKEHLDELPDRDRKELVEFFFSGDWIGIDDDGLPF